MSCTWEALVIWTCTLRASQRWGSLRDILKLGKIVTKTVPTFKMAWTVSMIAFWYSRNLESRSEILETTGSPLLSWKVSANLTAPKWRCVYLCFCHGITNSLGRARVIKFSSSHVGILKWSNLEAWTYSLTIEGWEGPINFFYGFFYRSLGFIKHSIRIYNREISKRDLTIFRYMRNLIQVI